MNYEPGMVSVNLDIEIENDLEVDADGNLFLLTVLYPHEGSDKDPSECKCLFEDVISNLLEFYKDNNPHSSAGQLHSIAHELDRAAERLREVAGFMESVRDGEISEDDISINTEVNYDNV
jgi:hypothetical protein